MVTTISPVVYRGRSLLRWSIAAQLHIVGAAIGGALTGLLLGLPGHWLHAPRDGHWRLTLAMLGTLGLGYGLAELGLLRLPHPQVTRQVPGSWRRRFHPWLTAALYGLGLGTGLTTRIVTGTVYVVLAGLICAADPLYGMTIFGLYGLSRGASAMLAGRAAHRARSTEQLNAAMRRLIGRQAPMRLLAGTTLAALSGYWIASFFSLMQ